MIKLFSVLILMSFALSTLVVADVDELRELFDTSNCPYEYRRYHGVNRLIKVCKVWGKSKRSSHTSSSSRCRTTINGVQGRWTSCAKRTCRKEYVTMCRLNRRCGKEYLTVCRKNRLLDNLVGEKYN